MKKIVKWILIVVVSLTAILYISLRVLRYQTKSHSPEEIITHSLNNSDLSVYYNRPYKKGREIFGQLVPFNEVWRTGANEASTFSTGRDLKIDGQTLEKGTYTLWTIPNEEEWTIIFNSKEYGWGVRMKDGKPSREEQYDVLKINVPVEKTDKEVEQFTIRFEEDPSLKLIMEWDYTRVSLEFD
tara:strand:+ start:3397 stop:3948 length:552 start_codon:yes stop_codon:yes gene_type:complete